MFDPYTVLFRCFSAAATGGRVPVRGVATMGDMNGDGIPDAMQGGGMMAQQPMMMGGGMAMAAPMAAPGMVAGAYGRPGMPMGMNRAQRHRWKREQNRLRRQRERQMGQARSRKTKERDSLTGFFHL